MPDFWMNYVYYLICGAVREANWRHLTDSEAVRSLVVLEY